MHAWSATSPAGRIDSDVLDTTGLVETDILGQPGVFLRPGDWLFGRGAYRVSTVLGSCVALVLWSPRMQLGALCHCMLPHRGSRSSGNEALDGRYGVDAGQWLEAQFTRHGCFRSEIDVAIAGGACVNDVSIGQANVLWAQDWVARQGLCLVQQDVGGKVVRRLTFNLGDGSLTISHGGRLGNMEV